MPSAFCASRRARGRREHTAPLCFRTLVLNRAGALAVPLPVLACGWCFLLLLWPGGAFRMKLQMRPTLFQNEPQCGPFT